MTNKPRILIVDDSPHDIHLLISALKSEYILSAGTSADQALEMLGTRELPNLILLDVNMPGTNGYEACKMIKADAHIADIDVIFLSANDSNDEIIKGLEVGALDYIVKPYDMELLKSKIKNAIDSHDKRIELKTQADQANQMVYAVLTESGNLGNIIQFFRNSFSASNAQALNHELIEALRKYNVNAVVSFKTQDVRELESTSGEISMLEIELLDRMHLIDQPFVEHGDRLFVIRSNTVLFVKNMPTDLEKRGSLKDHLMIMLEGANSRVDHLVKMSALNGHKNQKVSEVILKAKITLDEIHRQQNDYKKVGVKILDDMVANVESQFFSMGLTDIQEKQLMDILVASVEQSLSHMESGLEIDEKFKTIITELASIAKEAKTAYISADN